jgi:hypothetical protein
VQAFALDTRLIDADRLAMWGLYPDDSAVSDHLPVVVDPQTLIAPPHGNTGIGTGPRARTRGFFLVVVGRSVGHGGIVFFHDTDAPVLVADEHPEVVQRGLRGLLLGLLLGLPPARRRRPAPRVRRPP